MGGVSARDSEALEPAGCAVGTSGSQKSDARLEEREQDSSFEKEKDARRRQDQEDTDFLRSLGVGCALDSDDDDDDAFERIDWSLLPLCRRVTMFFMRPQ